MSSADVTRDGQHGRRPGRDAKMWDGGGRRGKGPSRAERDHPGDSYYGAPVISPPTWAELDVAGYLFLGGLAGVSSLLAGGARLTGRPQLAQRSGLCANGAISLSLVALIHDLGRPSRFLHMLRVFKPSSPMSVGVWLLGAYTPLAAAATASDLTGARPGAGRAAGVGAGIFGAGVATYTAALIANTAVPAWHDGHRELPFVFAGSAAGAAGGFGLLAAPLAQSGPARRMAVLGAAGELLAERRMEQRLGMVSEVLHEGRAGRRMKAAKLLTGAGAAGALAFGHRSRAAAALSGAALLAGSALTRFGIFAGGVASAEDPKYTVQPQRARRDAAKAAADAAD